MVSEQDQEAIQEAINQQGSTETPVKTGKGGKGRKGKGRKG
jgi:hypothetical protein